MTDTNELTGRELAVACARAMGWTVTKWDAWYDTEGDYSGTVEPDIDPREMLAWLHEPRGGIYIELTKLRGCEAKLWLRAGAGFIIQRARGATLTEALQRIVVAVAQRGSNNKDGGA